MCVPLDSPRVLYLRHHGALSSGWTQSSLCKRCARYYQSQTAHFLPMCTASSSCKCHVCLRQPPSLRGLASYTVFPITANISEFTLTSESLYHNYIHAVRIQSSSRRPTDSIDFSSFALRLCEGHGMQYPATFSQNLRRPCSIPLVHTHRRLL